MQAQAENTIVSFAFEGISIKESCWINGIPYFTRKSIGEFLEYEHPDQSVYRIVQRNPYIKKFSRTIKLAVYDEYAKGHSQVILTCECPPSADETVGHSLTNLVSECSPESSGEAFPPSSILSNPDRVRNSNCRQPDDTSKQRVRLIDVETYNPIGLQLIIFESHQPKAKRFKIAAANIVWAFATGELKPSKWSQKGDLISAARQILSLPEGRKRRELIVDLAERENRSLQSTYRNIYKATGERLKTKAGTPRRNRSDKGSFRGRPEYRQALNYKMQHPEATAPEIRSKLGISVPASRINSWMRETIH